MKKGLLAATTIAFGLSFATQASADQRYNDRYERPSYGDERLSQKELRDCNLDQDTYDYLVSGQLLVRSAGYDQMLPIMRPLASDYYGRVNISYNRLQEGLRYIEQIRDNNFVHPYTNDRVYASYDNPALLYTIKNDIEDYMTVINGCPNYDYAPVRPRDQYDRSPRRDNYGRQPYRGPNQ